MEHEPSLGAVICAPVCDEDVVLTRDFAFARPYWKFPGGSIKIGETPLEALAYESLEETGIDLGLCYMYGVPFLARRDIVVELLGVRSLMFGTGHMQYFYCVRIPQGERERARRRTGLGVKGERIQTGVFSLRHVSQLTNFLVRQMPLYFRLLRHLQIRLAA